MYMYIYIYIPPLPLIDYGERLAIGCGGKIRGVVVRFRVGLSFEEQRASPETVPGNGSVVRLKGSEFLNEGQPLPFSSLPSFLFFFHSRFSSIRIRHSDRHVERTSEKRYHPIQGEIRRRIDLPFVPRRES